MFKPHKGTCTACGLPGQWIAVKKGWCQKCNHDRKQDKKHSRTADPDGNKNKHGSFPSAESNAEDIEGYTRSYRSPIRKKAIQRGRKRKEKGSDARGNVEKRVPGLSIIRNEHTYVYLKILGYNTAEFIPCEISGERAVDIHHIFSRGMGGSSNEHQYNSIENLMGLSRELHEKYGDKKQYYDFLIQKHFEFLSANGVPYDPDFFEKWY